MFVALLKSLWIFLENILNGVYEESDITKVREDPRFVELYLKHNKGDVDKAVKFMHTSLEWRKSFGVKGQLCNNFEFRSSNNVALKSWSAVEWWEIEKYRAKWYKINGLVTFQNKC